jgi:hypothetical protein
MATTDTRDPLRRALDRIELCTYAIQEAHLEVEYPSDPEHKADLLLAAERLTVEAVDLLQTARLYAWGLDEEDDELCQDL